MSKDAGKLFSSSLEGNFHRFIKRITPQPFMNSFSNLANRSTSSLIKRVSDQVKSSLAGIGNGVKSICVCERGNRREVGGSRKRRIIELFTMKGTN